MFCTVIQFEKAVDKFSGFITLIVELSGPLRPDKNVLKHILLKNSRLALIIMS